MLGGVPVDLQRLFRAVLSKGGFDQVCCAATTWRGGGMGGGNPCARTCSTQPPAQMDKFRAWPQLIQRFKVPRQLPRAASKFRLLYRYRLHRLEKSCVIAGAGMRLDLVHNLRVSPFCPAAMRTGWRLLCGRTWPNLKPQLEQAAAVALGALGAGGRRGSRH